MEIYHGVDAQIPPTPTVVTIGVFDGVHRGHREIIERTIAIGHAEHLRTMALTFDPHPLRIHRPELNFDLVTSLADRLESLAALGLDATWVIDYSLEFAQATPREFVQHYLVERLNARAVVVGEDARFGKGNSGDVTTLAELGKELGFSVTIIPDHIDEESGRRWSSTWVRELLGEGKVGEAATVLGRNHRLRGVVVHGKKLGRTLGYPTANLNPDDLGVVPADGVYAGWLRRPHTDLGQGEDGLRLPAAISIGTNTTFGAVQRTVEAHVLGRSDLDLYGEEVVVELCAFLRPMLTFDSVDELLEHMASDVADSARLLGVPIPAPIDPQAVSAGR